MNQDRLKEILTVHTYTRPNLRDDEMYVYVGQVFLMDLFDSDKDITDTKQIQLIYPERWLNVIEQRILFDAILNRCPNVEKLHIITHSVYIMQCTPNGCLFICDKASDYPEQSYVPGVRYCPSIKPDVGLQVLHL
jgi:hypothetical protein